MWDETWDSLKEKNLAHERHGSEFCESQDPPSPSLTREGTNASVRRTLTLCDAACHAIPCGSDKRSDGVYH